MIVHNDTTNKQDVIDEKNVHNHGEKVDNAAVVIARTACKRKATEDAGVRPLKLIRESNGQVDLEEVGDITVQDVSNIRAYIFDNYISPDAPFPPTFTSH